MAQPGRPARLSGNSTAWQSTGPGSGMSLAVAKRHGHAGLGPEVGGGEFSCEY